MVVPPADGAFTCDAPRMSAWRRATAGPSEPVNKADRPAAESDTAADVSRLARPLTAAQSLGPGSAEGVPLLPAPWPMFPHGHSTLQASVAAPAPAGDGDMASGPATAADTKDRRHGIQTLFECKDAAAGGRQQRSRRVLSSDGSLGSFMRAEAAACATPRVPSPPHEDRGIGLELAPLEPLQPEHDADVSQLGAASVEDDCRDSRTADPWPDSRSDAEPRDAVSAGLHSAITGSLSEQMAPQARTAEEHPLAYIAAPVSGEISQREIAQTRPADAGSAAVMQNTTAGGSHVTVGSPEPLHGVDLPAALNGSHPTSSASTATGEGELRTSV